jgi:hypothetical protein
VNRRKWHHIFKFRGHKTVSNEIWGKFLQNHFRNISLGNARTHSSTQHTHIYMRTHAHTHTGALTTKITVIFVFNFFQIVYNLQLLTTINCTVNAVRVLSMHLFQIYHFCKTEISLFLSTLHISPCSVASRPLSYFLL